jgi:hypothetical protein
MASFFDTLFSPFNPDIGANAAQQAASAQQAGITQGYNDLSNLYGQGRGALQTNYTAGLAPLLQNYAAGSAGTGQFGNALGLGGPQGNVQAQQAFWNNPAIAAQIQTGTQNVLRNAGASGGGAGGGGAASGATMAALQDLAQKNVAGGWQNYVSNLQNYLPFSSQAATGVLGGYGGLGSGLNQSFMGQGGAAASADAAKAAAQANADLAAAKAQYGAGQNIWGAAMGGAGALASFFSDIRVKDDVEQIGRLDDGLPVYRFRYKGTPETRIGVMAQDVEKVAPEAVSEFHGIKTVDYKKATDVAADLHKFFEAV